MIPRKGLKHGAVFVRTLAEHLLALGYSKFQVFDGTPFDAELLTQEKPVADFVDIAAFFEHASNLAQNETLGFEFGETREMRRIGLLCYVGLSAPTVLDFFRNVANYRRVFSDAIDIDISELEETGVLKWTFLAPDTTNRRQYVEFGASGILACLRQATHQEIRLL